MTEKLYPIAQVAAELDCGTKDLRRRLNGQVVRDENLMRCVPGSVVRQLIEARDAELVARREDARQRRGSRQPNPYRERVRAIRAMHREIRPEQLEGATGMSEKALMTVLEPTSSADYDDRMRDADERTGDFLSGTMQLRKIGPARAPRKPKNG